MAKLSRVCTSCGSILREGEEKCSLCGQPVSGDDGSVEDGLPEPGDSADLPRAAEVFDDLPDASEEPVESSVEDTDSPVTTKKSGLGAIVLMAGLLLVVGLYLISSISGSKPADLEPEPTAIAELQQQEVQEPLAATIVEEVSRIREEADGLQGTARLDKMRELAVLYQNHTRFDLAADTQVEIAEESGMEIDWVRAGNLYYDWMESRQPGTAKAVYARKAIAAYQKALEINPDNLDVRTDMAVAYLFDPENPMQAIINTNQVLQADSLHLQANFNRGIMLMQINRMDDALQQFRKVQRLAPDTTSPVHQRAAEAIRLIESRPAANGQ